MVQLPITGKVSMDAIVSSKRFCQVGLVVRDCEKSARSWAGILGVAPPAVMITDDANVSHIEYRGSTTPARAKLAFFELGALQLELIEPVDGPSTWRDFLEAKGEGVHHLAFAVDGMDRVIDNLGQSGGTLEQRGDYTGGRYGYVDMNPTLGLVLELLENMPVDRAPS